mmetsp:Transcript_14665/g.42913  ORF Transcript_14665/g.42913 Transcript_14665/m.42913 type:complete len:232 (+) Transcript_14665:577-1272(+)
MLLPVKFRRSLKVAIPDRSCVQLSVHTLFTLVCHCRSHGLVTAASKLKPWQVMAGSMLACSASAASVTTSGQVLVQRILVARVHVLHHALVHPAQVAGRHVLAHALFHEACGAHHCLGLVDLAHTKVGVGQPHGQLGVIVVGPHQLAECVGPLELHLGLLEQLLALVDLGLLERSRRVLGRILDEIEDLLVDLDKQQAVMREALLVRDERLCKEEVRLLLKVWPRHHVVGD